MEIVNDNCYLTLKWIINTEGGKLFIGAAGAPKKKIPRWGLKVLKTIIMVCNVRLKSTQIIQKQLLPEPQNQKISRAKFLLKSLLSLAE